MKKLWQKFMAWLAKRQKKVVVEPDVKPTPNDVPKPLEPSGDSSQCGCDLSKPYQSPPYEPSYLKSLGNESECPTIAGRDCRLAVVRHDAKTPWLIGMLLPKACDFSGSRMSCKCFDADNGRYHFTGYSRKFDKSDFVSAKSGESFQYKTTTFIWYEYRK